MSSDQNTKIEDNFGNTHFKVDSFVFEINKNLIKANNLSVKMLNYSILLKRLLLILILAWKSFCKRY